MLQDLEPGFIRFPGTPQVHRRGSWPHKLLCKWAHALINEEGERNPGKALGG